MPSVVLEGFWGMVACLVMVVLLMVFQRYIGKRNPAEKLRNAKQVWLFIVVAILLVTSVFGKYWLVHLFEGGNPK